MKNLKRIVMSLAVLLAAIPVGCRKESPDVAVIPRTTGTLLWEPLHMGVVETARASGIHIDWSAPADEGDTEKQLSTFASSAARKYRGIIFAPDETLASRSIVLDAVRRQIPVVVIDDELGPPAGAFLSYVSNDDAKGARLAAARVAEILHGRGVIAIIGISPRSESGLSREEEFERALGQIAPGVRVSIRHFGDPVVTHQQQIAQQIMNAHALNSHAPDSHDGVDAIVALTATATRGAYYAKMASEPRSPVLIVGFDQDALLPIKSGEVDSVVVQDTRSIGQAAMTNLEAQMRGGSAQPVTLVPPLLLTRASMDSAEITRLWQFADYPWGQQ